MPREKNPMVSCSPEAGIVTRTLLKLGYTFVPGDCYRAVSLPPFSFAVDGGRYWAKRDKQGFTPVDFAITTTGAVSFWHIHPQYAAGDEQLDRIEDLLATAIPPYLQSVTNVPSAVLHRYFGDQPLLGEVLRGVHATNDVLAFLRQQWNEHNT